MKSLYDPSSSPTNDKAKKNFCMHLKKHSWLSVLFRQFSNDKKYIADKMEISHAIPCLNYQHCGEHTTSLISTFVWTYHNYYFWMSFMFKNIERWYPLLMISLLPLYDITWITTFHKRSWNAIYPHVFSYIYNLRN